MLFAFLHEVLRLSNTASGTKGVLTTPAPDRQEQAQEFFPVTNKCVTSTSQPVEGTCHAGQANDGCGWQWSLGRRIKETAMK